MRERLPSERKALTKSFHIGEIKAYITLGFYPDGRPGEVFLNVSKAGSTMSGLADAVATMISVALQHGAPLETIIAKLEYTNFEPAGRTGDQAIPEVSSLLDYVGKWLKQFIPPEA